jgi:hypothetical protein
MYGVGSDIHTSLLWFFLVCHDEQKDSYKIGNLPNEHDELISKSVHVAISIRSEIKYSIGFVTGNAQSAWISYEF